MMINPADLMKIKKARDIFVANHPKFPAFLSAVGRDSIQVDSVIEITVTPKDGELICSNIKVKESDMELLNMIISMSK